MLKDKRETAQALLFFLILPLFSACACDPKPTVLPSDADKEAVRKAALAGSDLMMLFQGVRHYQVRHGKLPYSLSALKEFNAAYSIDKDPWGGIYRYSFGGERDFTLRSRGPDGKESTADDLVYTQKNGLLESINPILENDSPPLPE